MVTQPPPMTRAVRLERAFDASVTGPPISHRQFSMLLALAFHADDLGCIDIPPWEPLQETANLGKVGARNAFVRLVELGYLRPETGTRYRLACVEAQP